MFNIFFARLKLKHFGISLKSESMSQSAVAALIVLLIQFNQLLVAWPQQMCLQKTRKLCSV